MSNVIRQMLANPDLRFTLEDAKEELESEVIDLILADNSTYAVELNCPGFRPWVIVSRPIGRKWFGLATKWEECLNIGSFETDDIVAYCRHARPLAQKIIMAVKKSQEKTGLDDNVASATLTSPVGKTRMDAFTSMVIASHINSPSQSFVKNFNIAKAAK